MNGYLVSFRQFFTFLTSLTSHCTSHDFRSRNEQPQTNLLSSYTVHTHQHSHRKYMRELLIHPNAITKSTREPKVAPTLASSSPQTSGESVDMGSHVSPARKQIPAVPTEEILRPIQFCPPAPLPSSPTPRFNKPTQASGKIRIARCAKNDMPRFRRARSRGVLGAVGYPRL